MNNLLRLCLATLMLVGLAGVLPLHAQRPNGDPVYYWPPALAGNNGKVFIGLQTGTILYGTLIGDTVIVTDSAAPGGRLPATVDGIWDLAMPNVATLPNLVVGLVSYSAGPTRAYAFIRSTDLGANWTLVTHPAFTAGNWMVSNDFWSPSVLQHMTWMPDGQHGWIYGTGGILATSDCGSLWHNRTSTSDSGTGMVRAMAMESPTLGAYARGNFIRDQFFGYTENGGDSFAFRGIAQGTNRILQIEYVGGRYHALVMDRAKNEGDLTTLVGRSTNPYALVDSTRPRGTMTRAQSYMTRILWVSSLDGYMVLKSGMIYQTIDGGLRWSMVRDADPNYPMPLNSSQGFGYNSIILDNAHIVQASTLQASGKLYRLYAWPITPNGVPSEQEIASEISVRPNAQVTEARVLFGKPVGAKAAVSLLNVMGKTVRTYDAPGAGSTTYSIDISDLPSGSYLVCLRDGGIRTGRLLVFR